MTMIKTVLLDIDDVLADCTGAAMRYMGLKDFDTWRDHKDTNDRDICKSFEEITGVLYTNDNWWAHFDQEFWATIPKSPWCDDLIDFAVSEVRKKNVFICTTPTNEDSCSAGKINWIQNTLPEWLHRQYIFTPVKEVCATPGALLIDDLPDNIESFREAGGYSVLFPAPWNEYHIHINNPIQFLWYETLPLHRK